MTNAVAFSNQRRQERTTEGFTAGGVRKYSSDDMMNLLVSEVDPRIVKTKRNGEITLISFKIHARHSTEIELQRTEKFVPVDFL